MSFLGTRIQFKTRFSIVFNPPSSSSRLHKPVQHRTLKMSTTQSKSKRPICPSCSKPARTCLCSRIRVSGIENSVHVTILQHALETKHPLNSTRIARMGLKNLTVATLSDVNFGARFVIRLIEPNCRAGSAGNAESGLFCGQPSEIGETQKLFCGKDRNLIDDGGGKCGLENGVCDDGVVVNDEVEKKSRDSAGFDPKCGVYGEAQKLISEKDCSLIDGDGKCGLENGVCYVGPVSAVVNNGEVEKNSNKPNSDKNFGVCEEVREPAIDVAIGKYGSICSLSHIWMPKFESSKKLSFDNVLAHHEACEALSKGFWVKKLQSREMDGGIDMEEFEEFELEVPPGSVLLFPSDKAVNVSELDDVGFEVKNLIVLDGTWAKAKRVYSENPWLNILPHLKLEVNEVSLYSDVRHQPKAGYLSTIESIVHALKAFGENHEALDSLLDTFESMVGDQRRCKDERLSKLLPV